MKRVFKYKKTEEWDGDEEIIWFLMDYLLHKNSNNYRKNWKVTIDIQEV